MRKNIHFVVGFPVDGGELSYIVLVKARLARYHSCKNGGVSGLRAGSGAMFVWERLPLSIKERYRLEFEPVSISMPNANMKPDNLADTGYSDSLACAIAIAQYTMSPREDMAKDSLILFSASFFYQEISQGLEGLLIEQVSQEDRPLESSRSLYNKWKIACKNHALALVLAQKDAEILEKEFSIKSVCLEESIFEKILKHHPGETMVVSCQKQDLLLLVKALGWKSHLFARDRKTGYKKICWASVLFLMALSLFFFIFLNSAKEKKNFSFWQTLSVRKVYHELSKIELEGGFLQGVASGSIFVLVSESISGCYIPVIVQDVYSFYSIARTLNKEEKQRIQEHPLPFSLCLDEPIKLVTEGWKAKELFRNQEEIPIKIFFPKQPHDNLEEILQNLVQEKWIDRVADMQKANVVAYQEKDSIQFYPGVVESSSWKNLPCVSICLKDKEEAREKILETIGKWTKSLRLFSLPAPETEMKAKIELVKVAFKSGKWFALEPFLDIPVMKHGETFGIQISNQGKEKVYPTLFYINSVWNLSILFPLQSPQSIDPGETKLLVSLKADTSCFWGKEIVKIFIITVPVSPREFGLSLKHRELSKIHPYIPQPVHRMFRKFPTEIAWKTKRDVYCMENQPDWNILTLCWYTRKK